MKNMWHSSLQIFKCCIGVIRGTPQLSPDNAISWYHHYSQYPGATCLNETLYIKMYWKDMQNNIQIYYKNYHRFQANKKNKHKYGNVLTYSKDVLSIVPIHNLHIPLVLGSQFKKMYELNKWSEDPTSLDLGSNFQGSAEQSTASKDLLSKSKYITSV
jgi:hypothetical protein